MKTICKNLGIAIPTGVVKKVLMEELNKITQVDRVKKICKSSHEFHELPLTFLESSW